MAETHFTPTQQRFLAVLADGLPHAREELRVLLWDEQGDRRTVITHLCKMRKLLRPRGHDIICELHYSRICYRWIKIQPISVASLME